MPGMYGNSSRLFGFAMEARDRTRSAIEAQPYAAPGDAVVAVIMSVIAAEAVVNELAEAARVFDGVQDEWAEAFSRKGPARNVISSFIPEQALQADPVGRAKLASLARLLRTIEDEHGSVQLKYQIAALALSGSTFDPGSNPFQDFDALVALRNLFVHFRPRDRFLTNDQGFVTGNEHPTVVRMLQQRGLARRPGLTSIQSWSGTVMTREVADWACQTALEMICAVVTLIPSGPTRMFFLSFERMRENQRRV